MFANIKNGQLAKRSYINQKRKKLCELFLNILWTEGFIVGYKIEGKDQGKIAYLGVCTGCHAYTGQLIGPPIKDIQSIYQGNPEALASYIAKPFKKRPTFPEMPPQNYLPEETRLAVAEYVLSLKN